LKIGSTPPLSSAYGGGFGKTPRGLGEKKYTNNANRLFKHSIKVDFQNKLLKEYAAKEYTL
jgi:hypothetical protein